MRSLPHTAARAVLTTFTAVGLAVMPLLAPFAGTPVAHAASMVIDHSGAGTTVAEPSGSDIFEVRLSEQPDSNVVIEVISQDSTEMTVSPSTLTFTQGNFDNDQAVTVTAVDDNLADGTQTANVLLRVLTSSDPDFPVGMQMTVAITVTDNEPAVTAGITVSRTALTVSESGTSEDFTVRLSAQPAAGTTVVVNVTSDDTGEATVTTASSLVFTSLNWDQPQTVRVTGQDDTSADGSQTTDITLHVDDAATTDNAFDAVADINVVATTIDNEPATAAFSVNDSSMSVSETGTQDTFTVVLSRQPASDVVISVVSNDTSEAGVSPSQLTFTSGNWNQPQTITVTGQDDVSDDGDQSGTITLSVIDSLSDNDFDSASDMTVTVTTSDNDPGSVRMTPVALTPADDAKLTGMNTELRWTQEAGTRWFELMVTPFNNDGPGIHLVISDDTQVAAASYTIEDPDFGTSDPNYVLLPDMTYTWQVRTAIGTTQPVEADWSSWSVARQFETGNKTSATISLMGVSTSSPSPTRPTLVWTNSDNDLFYYEVQVSRDSSFCNSLGCPTLHWELRHGGLTSPMNSYTVPSAYPLQSDATYFWRVRPRIQGDGTPVAWTPASSFRTD